MPAKAYIVHAVAGRARFRVPDRRGDEAFFRELEARLRRCRGVEEAAARALTGSIVIRYAGEFQSLIAAAAMNGVAAMVRIEPGSPPMREAIAGEVRRLDARLATVTAGAADLRTALGLGLLALGGVQLMRGQVLAPAATLLWYAGEMLGVFRPPGAALPPAPASASR